MKYERLHGYFSSHESVPDTAYHSGKINLSPSLTIKLAASRDFALMVSDEFTHAGGNIKLHSSTSDNLQLGLAWQSRL